eukprot:jgi/Mesvir1/6966/Mv09111-RA.1
MDAREAFLTCRCSGGTKIPLSMLSFFARRAHEGCHLIVKPERARSSDGRLRENLATQIELIQNPKEKARQFSPHKILCASRLCVIGNECHTGPDNELVLCFDSKGVILDGTIAHGKGKWSSIAHMFPRIETRDCNNFSGRPAPPQYGTSRESNKTLVPTMKDADSSARLDIRSLSTCRPRGYQIELLLQSLRRNTLIFLPTGAGKTLVAAMLLKRMRQLNPGKKALFIVHRVPLVYQQGAYIRQQTGLCVTELCGEMMLPRATSTARIAACDVLVATAGLVLNLLADGCLDLGECSAAVFDEAHNARGDHAYASILSKYYHPCPEHARPVLLALSASPAGEATLARTEARLRQMCQLYQCRVCMPWHRQAQMEEFTNRPDVEWHVAHLTDEERNFLSDTDAALHLLQGPLETSFAPCWDTTPGVAQWLANLRPDADAGHLYGSLRGLKEAAVAGGMARAAVLADHALTLGLLRELILVVGCEEARTQLRGCYRTAPTAPASKKRRRAKEDDEEDNECIGQFSGLEPDVVELTRGVLARQLAPPSSSVPSSSPLFSSRVNSLVTLLEEVVTTHDASDIRILVFVQLRRSAYLLADTLANVPSLAPLRPRAVVGHGGTDGMKWQEQQKPLLRKFASGMGYQVFLWFYRLCVTNVQSFCVNASICSIPVGMWAPSHLPQS